MPISRRFDRVLLIVGLLLALGFIATQAVHRIEYFRGATALAKPPPELAAIPGVQPREVILPISSVDSCWWIFHTEAMLRSGDWRVRSTDRDNAPLGREVHWSSGFMWFLAFLAWLIHLASGLTTLAAVQHAALIAGPLLFAAFVLGFAWLAARRWGGAVGGFLALGLATLGPLDSFFCAGEADHHGIVSCFALGCVLAAIAAGGGRARRDGLPAAPHALVPDRAAARRWMMLSGLLGAAGLWVSAATVVPALAGIALGALFAAWKARQNPDDTETEASPELWRLWGAAGALGSLGFYLLEYAPDHFGWRLEVNHPLYALAWWGGGELLARACGWIQRRSFAPTPRDRVLVGAAALVALLALPLTVNIGGARVFTISDSFLWNLHEGYILEFRTLFKMLSSAAWPQYFTALSAWLLLAVPAAWLLLRRPDSRGQSAPLALALGAALPLTALSLLQLRWLGVSQTLWLALAVTCLVRWRLASPRPAKAVNIAAALLLLLGLGAFPAVSIPRWGHASGVGAEEAVSVVMRDVAWKLRIAAGPKPLNIVSGPTTTTNLAFYGDTRGVGTLYWENIAGLKTVGAIYGAKSEQEALELCRKHEVTHIVIFSWDAFAQPYARLHHGRPVDANTDDCFVSSLLNTRSIPLWLRPLAYKMLPELAQAGQWVQIFEVRPEQTQAEAFFHLGRYLSATDLGDQALNAFIQSWNLDPAIPGSGLELGLALVKAGRVQEAEGVAALVPADQRLPIDAALGRRLARDGAQRPAVAALRRALELAPADRELMTDLAWLLATSPDDTLRDGAESLRLMKQLAAAGQMNFREVDAFAAAHAERGDFSEALTLIDQAIVAARKESAEAVVKELEERRSRYALRRPFRLEAAR
jgi:tetratricopeptide (TPR) repeat protein